MAKPHASSLLPATVRGHGTLVALQGTAGAAPGHAYWTGARWVSPAVKGVAPRSTPRLLVPPRPIGASRTNQSGSNRFPSAFYSSTQVDAATSGCTNPYPNEPSVAQSVDNPNDVVVAAQAYVDATGACADSHPWVFYSHDGGQHWREQIMPGLTAGLAGGDVGVVYDAKHHVFVYSFMQFSRTTSANSVDVASSTDGASWFDLTTLDNAPGSLDKDMITVNQDPSSSDYGRVLVSWRDESIGQDAFIDAYSDNGGATWTRSSDSINVVPDCGNGTSPAFDANGEAMVAWEDCNGGNRIEEELSTNGGASWTAPSNTVISGVNALDASGCALSAGGTAFRCNSFPSLAGDPNPSDAGGRAFFVVFANEESTSQGGVTATVSQLHGLSTTDAGASWNGGPSFSFDYMAFDDFGDKFFPWAAFAPNGRLNVGYSDREGSASNANPNGSSYNEGQAEAGSLSSLRSDAYIAYTADGTLGNPGSLTFIGDYAGIESQDNNFDTYPVWTDVRNGTADVRTMDLCYSDCPTSLQPEAPISVSHTAGTSFTDLYKFNTDPSFGGAGSDYWNVVGIREGADGTSVDDDLGLWNSRYFSSRVALGDFGPPYNDYVLENGNVSASQPYFVDVHSFSNHGGSYAVEWAHGHIVLNTSFADSMGPASVVRVYDTLDHPSTTYHVGLRPTAGNTSNYRVSLHLSGNGAFQGSNLVAATSGNAAPGSPALLTANTGSSPFGYDAVVVQNNNGGSGSYRLYRDTAAPAGTITINGGAAYTRATGVTLGLSASNPTVGDPVFDVRFSNNGVSFGPWQPYAPAVAYSLPAGDGTKTVFAQFRNGAGAISASAVAHITLDTTPPTIIKVPGPRLVSGQIGTVNVPVNISWLANDALSGVAGYALRESINGGPFVPVPLVSPGTPHVTLNLAPGHTYRFSVRATDHAGNTSAFVSGSTFKLTALQETAAGIVYSSGWHQQAVPGAYGGFVKFSAGAGKKAWLVFTGSQVAWVSTVAGNRGSASVRLDAGPTVTISTHGAIPIVRDAVDVLTTTPGGHILAITNQGTIGHPRVDVDAFIIIS
jgi:hypothetical protein